MINPKEVFKALPHVQSIWLTTDGHFHLHSANGGQMVDRDELEPESIEDDPELDNLEDELNELNQGESDQNDLNENDLSKDELEPEQDVPIEDVPEQVEPVEVEPEKDDQVEQVKPDQKVRKLHKKTH